LNYNKYIIISPLEKGKISGPLTSTTLLARYLNEEFIEIDKVQMFTSDKISFEHNGIEINNASKLKFSSKNIYIVTGIFSLKILLILFKLILFRCDYIISLRGNLTRNAFFKKSFFKKLLYSPFIFIVLIFTKKIHYLSELEMINSFNIFRNKSFYYPNPISIEKPIDSLTFSNDSSNRTNINCVFIGRYDIKHKGLDNLINFVRLNENFICNSNIQFILYGTNYRSGIKYLNSQVKKYKLNKVITINPPLLNYYDKREVYSFADYAFHFSRYEGVPQSIVEALSFFKKVIITTNCNIAKDELTDGSIIVENLDVKLIQNILDNRFIQPTKSNLKVFNIKEFLDEIY
jgi:glycosyltransferase involved in cell wall biosynthesis